VNRRRFFVSLLAFLAPASRPVLYGLPAGVRVVEYLDQFGRIHRTVLP
jgi:hypothetical protein